MGRHFYWVGIADVPQWVIRTPGPAVGGTFEEPWMFGDGRILPNLGPIKADVAHQGKSRAFVLSGIEQAPIANELVANVFSSLAPGDVQLLPVSIEGESERYFVVNATRVIDCIDEARCREVHHYDEDAPPGLEGEYNWIYGLRIDPSKTEGAQVFRLKKFKVAFIVSEDVKNALEAVGNLGVSFERVTGLPST
ncbi:hypothetical protein EJ065_6437 [Corallococcus coralloides]|uniref:Immunity MXAN-0049 protein domain-containing protein n=1 Tax=Corallococcus coralloides TaxID=184914 RepID=A0A410S1M0_CORCK|nr:DUF1629 domain-containing protein [Corallococcus coralloides]QAT87966.1 hypothetical protein EJ065_6437 [Corallococcus coralloides]